MKNRLVSIDDLTSAEVREILDLAAKVKADPEAYKNALHRSKFALIFEKPSTRTWVSFDTGIYSLGGSTIYLGPDDIKLGVREEVRDVARVLDRYLSGVILRTYKHDTILEMARYFTKPVINGLSDHEHPCQALADYLTIEEHVSGKKKPVVGYVGDGNNVLNSLMLITAKTGSEIRYATPARHEPDPRVVSRAKTIARKTGARILGTHDPVKAVRGADVLYTDVWVSMGEEKLRAEKLKAFKGFQVNKKLMACARGKAIVMHCLPAHRGEEITDNVIESRQSVVFDQAENRLHAQKAVLLFLSRKTK